MIKIGQALGDLQSEVKGMKAGAMIVPATAMAELAAPKGGDMRMMQTIERKAPGRHLKFDVHFMDITSMTYEQRMMRAEQFLGEIEGLIDEWSITSLNGSYERFPQARIQA